MEEINAARISYESAKSKHIQRIEAKFQLLNDGADEIGRGFAELKTKQNLLSKENDGANVDDEDLLEINAGGQIVAATRKTLTQLKGTRLEALFSGRWEKKLQRDQNGRVFLDVNGSCFCSIVDYLNELMISSPEDPPDPPHVDEENRFFLEKLLTVFGLDEFLSGTVDSHILKDEDYSMMQDLHSFFNEDGIDGNMGLLYRGSRDTFGASVFHKKCDNMGPTVTIIKSDEGFIFGGYADVSWSCGNVYHTSDKAFLFALKNHSGIGATKMRVEPRMEAFYHHPNYGPTFGQGHDMHVCDNSNVKKGSNFNFHSYCKPDGQSNHFITGTREFLISEIEVFGFENSKKPCLQHIQKENAPLVNSKEEWETMTYDEFPTDVKTALDEGKKTLLKTKIKLQQQTKAFDQEKHFIDTFASGDNEDLVQLNVRGERMVIKRSTLGICKESVLAKKFDSALWKQAGSCRSVKNWDFAQVAEWASNKKDFPREVAEKLRENKINGNELLSFDFSILKGLGINRPGTIALALCAIKELNSSFAGGVILIEHSAYCFSKIIDQLRLHAMCKSNEVHSKPKIREEEKKRFKRIEAYYFPGDEGSSLFL